MGLRTAVPDAPVGRQRIAEELFGFFAVTESAVADAQHHLHQADVAVPVGVGEHRKSMLGQTDGGGIASLLLEHLGAPDLRDGLFDGSVVVEQTFAEIELGVRVLEEALVTEAVSETAMEVCDADGRGFVRPLEPEGRPVVLERRRVRRRLEMEVA